MFVVYLLIIAAILIFINRRTTRHKFWDKQPVSRTGVGEGIISDIPEPLPVDDSLSIVKLNPKDKFVHRFLVGFLTKHYVKNCIYNTNYVSWYLSNLKPNNILALTRDNHRIGTIFAKPYTINIKGDILPSHYVDFLSVHKDFRNKSYAPLLISHTAKESSDEKYKTFIFKKEDKPLPFNYIAKCRYYVYEIPRKVNNMTSKYSLTRSTSDDMEYLIDLYNRESPKYKCHPIFDSNELRYIFTSKNEAYESLIIKKDGVRKGVITYVINTGSSSSSQVAEIALFLYDGVDYTGVMKSLIKYCHKNSFDLLMCVNNAKNYNFIDMMDFDRGMDVYFHMYNYHMNETLVPEDILFNYI
jgi:hypothetical protein